MNSSNANDFLLAEQPIRSDQEHEQQHRVDDDVFGSEADISSSQLLEHAYDQAAHHRAGKALESPDDDGWQGCEQRRLTDTNGDKADVGEHDPADRCDDGTDA